MATRTVVLTITSDYYAPYGSNDDYFKSSLKDYVSQTCGINILSLGMTKIPNTTENGRITFTLTIKALTQHTKDMLKDMIFNCYNSFLQQKSERTAILNATVNIVSDAADNTPPPVVTKPKPKQTTPAPPAPTVQPQSAPGITPDFYPSPYPSAYPNKQVDLFGTPVPMEIALLGGVLLFVILIRR